MKKNIIVFFIIVIISSPVVLTATTGGGVLGEEFLLLTLKTNYDQITPEFGISSKPLEKFTDEITYLANNAVIPLSVEMDESGNLMHKGNSYYLNWKIISSKKWDVSLSLSNLTHEGTDEQVFYLTLTKVSGDETLESQYIESGSGEKIIYTKYPKDNNHIDFGSMKMDFGIQLSGTNDTLYENYTSDIIIKMTGEE